MSLDWGYKPSVYTIQPGVSFVDALAHGLYAMAENDPLKLARMRVLLPTRRACRSLREAFLRITNGKPLLLPQLHPIGDVDDEELSLLLSGIDEELSLPPALAPLRRQFMLTRLIAARGYSRGLEQDLNLAAALGRLMDQIYTEDLDLKNLPAIVDAQQFSRHWQISLDFLTILSEFWPQILQENGVLDAADRRNRLLKSLGRQWRDHPPENPIIAAGSTGSIPATAELLNTIANLPKGCIVVPGLDQVMDDESWRLLSDTHPQATLRHLLSGIGISRQAVKDWPFGYGDYRPAAQRLELSSEIMRPAETSGAWQTLQQRLPGGIEGLDHIERYDCAHPQEEALVIALALRRNLVENKTGTAALVTPDRRLARRVAMICRRWNIEVDDSAGEPLDNSDIGVFLRLCLNTVMAGMKPVSLLSFCKHDLCRPAAQKQWRGHIRDLDRRFLRAPFFGEGMPSYDVLLRHNEAKGRDITATKKLLGFIGTSFAPLLAMEGTHTLTEWCVAHLKVVETFSDADLLWSGEAGEAAAMLFSELQEQGDWVPTLTLNDYTVVLKQAMKNIAVRPAYGLHPRLMILGQLEARLVEADLMILGSLNEGIWPPDSATDPWMSRPMRRRFGLPSPERAIGLAAHDFAQAFCAQRVILTRSLREDGAPSVPSRWLQRLHTVRQALGTPPEEPYPGDLLSYARAIDKQEEFAPYGRPAPTPPLSVRPRELWATHIETWMQDPYSLYAKKILGLRKLDSLERPFDAAMRGEVIHTALKHFVAACPDRIPSNAWDIFISLAKSEMEALSLPLDIQRLWEPRLEKLAGWLLGMETGWRLNYKPAAQEIEGQYIFDAAQGAFTVKAKADRIDVLRDGSAAAIVDYKSGAGAYSAPKLQNGLYPQLPLEALILEKGSFGKLRPVTTEILSYWIVNGSGDEGGDEKSFDDPAKLQKAKENAEQGLKDLVDAYDKEGTAYISLPHPARIPRYNDYEHLARVKEWAALDDQGEDAA